MIFKSNCEIVDYFGLVLVFGRILVYFSAAMPSLQRYQTLGCPYFVWGHDYHIVQDVWDLSMIPPCVMHVLSLPPGLFSRVRLPDV